MPGVTQEVARDARGQWLVEIDAGRVFRFSTKPAEVPRESGEVLTFEPGLGDFTLGSSMGAEVSVGLQIDAGITSQGELLNWAILVGEGIDLEQRPAVLRRWFPGQTFEEARVWLRGTTIGAAYGDPDAHIGRLTISIERKPSAGNTIPDAQKRVSGDTWNVRVGWLRDANIDGSTYPLVIGAPGTDPSNIATPSTPMLLVEVDQVGTTNRGLIAGHRVEATAVRLYDQSKANPGIGINSSVITTLDRLGQTVSAIDFTEASPEGRKYYIGWQFGVVGAGGGVIDPRTNRLVRGGADLITFLLTLNGTRVDFGRMTAVELILNSYKFDTFINAPMVAFQFLQQAILPLLPVVEREGEAGLYYAVERWQADPTEVTVRLDADNRRVRRTAPLVRRQQAAELFNEFSIEYAPFLVTGRFSKTLTLTAQAGFLSDVIPGSVDPDDRILEDYRCALSRSRFKTRKAPLIQATAIYDDATALLILRDRAARDALPKRVTQYEGGPELEWVPEGAIAEVLDGGVGLNGAIARVDNVTVGDGVTVLDITLLDDPVQNPRLV